MSKQRNVTVIAEIGIAHGGDMGKAKEMIRHAKYAGADIAKFQIYRPEEVLGVDSPYFADAKKAELTHMQHHELKDFCDSVGIEWLASIFHKRDVPFTVSMGMQRYKIASRSYNQRDLFDEINKTGKPVLFSTGMMTDRREMVSAMRHMIDCEFTPMYCESMYPTPFNMIELRQVNELLRFLGRVGISSHCPDATPTIAAVSRGATFTENHVILDRSDPCCDAPSSLTFPEFAAMVKQIRVLEQFIW